MRKLEGKSALITGQQGGTLLMTAKHFINRVQDDRSAVSHYWAAVHASGRSRSSVSSVAGVRVNTDTHFFQERCGHDPMIDRRRGVAIRRSLAFPHFFLSGFNKSS